MPSNPDISTFRRDFSKGPHTDIAAFPAAQLGDVLLAAQSFQHDAKAEIIRSAPGVRVQGSRDRLRHPFAQRYVLAVMVLSEL
jgi:hypothetical protein